MFAPLFSVNESLESKIFSSCFHRNINIYFARKKKWIQFQVYRFFEPWSVTWMQIKSSFLHEHADHYLKIQTFLFPHIKL